MRNKKEGTYPGTINPDNGISLLTMLKPLDGTPENTLQFMISSAKEAGLEYNIFIQVPRLVNGKNPYGLNSTILAILDHFFQLGYFNRIYNLENILMAYFDFSGNHIKKLKICLSEFRQNKRYQKNMSHLISLKIKKLD